MNNILIKESAQVLHHRANGEFALLGYLRNSKARIEILQRLHRRRIATYLAVRRLNNQLRLNEFEVLTHFKNIGDKAIRRRSDKAIR